MYFFCKKKSAARYLNTYQHFFLKILKINQRFSVQQWLTLWNIFCQLHITDIFRYLDKLGKYAISSSALSSRCTYLSHICLRFAGFDCRTSYMFIYVFRRIILFVAVTSTLKLCATQRKQNKQDFSEFFVVFFL